MTAKTLYLDIETSPALADVWGLWNNNVSLNQLRESTRVLCFGAMWRGTNRVQFYSEPKDGHEGLVRKAHELLNEADIVVHFNGTSFDLPHLRREFLKLEIGRAHV